MKKNRINSSSNVVWKSALSVSVFLAFSYLFFPSSAANAGTPVPGAPSCPMFPANNVWNTDISGLPIQIHSSAWLSSMSAGTKNLHPDFGPSFGAQPVPYGIPYTVVDSSHSTTTPSFTYSADSDHVPYPFDANTPIEGGQNAGGDRHALMVNKDTCELYELFDAHYSSGGSTAGSGATWNLNSNNLRTAGFTSADAAGLPILPGLLRLDEVRSGSVTHAIRFTANRTDRSYLWPGRHQAGAASDANLPPMGARFRLRANFDISHYRPDTQVVLRAMQRYGLILADNGSDWFFSGSSEDGWDTNMLDQLKSIPASQFDAVDESSLMLDSNSGAVRQNVIETSGGYRLVARDGGVFAFGNQGFYGSTGGMRLNQPIVGIASTPTKRGYWLVAADGGVFSFGDARFFGSTGAMQLNQPIVGISATASGNGYRLVASDGGIFSFGDATFQGSTGNIRLNKPIVGMATSSNGYRLVASDGGIFSFGNAGFFGSTGGIQLNKPIVGMTPTPSGNGYLLVASDGGIFCFGDAGFVGSMGSALLNQPIVGITATQSGNGYYLAASDGGVYSFGDAGFYGSTGAIGLNQPIVSMS